MGYKFQDSTAIYQATWTSSTAQNATLAAYGWGYSTAMVTVQNTGTITGGAIGFQVWDGNNWFPVTGTELYSANTDQTYSLSGGSVAIACDMTGFSQFRVILSSTITGSGSCFVSINESGAPLSSLVGKTPGASGDIGVTQATTPWIVAGNVASLASDSGNPVKTGGVYNSGGIVATNGQRVDTQVNIQGATITDVQHPSTSTPTNVASSASSVTILAANGNRKGAMVFNDSTQTLYLLLNSGTASTTSYTVQIAPNGYYEFPQPVYTGAVTGIWASANGNARVTEMNP